ncbi:hypothetical protein [Winogradskyella psychrotolerans]|uniref:hypothetical protein n=1 Tax=Winogradskyella psychrotolerans TaxID=1344585 RepID=UPI001C06FA9F|nr:hypothetical protein [Winogradskyella psychrotolerans]MBU2929735.1 hypothetical protein [Winogradskyella psychrotolerans]
MKRTAIITIITLILSCQKTKTEIYFYPSKEIYKNSQLEKIDLDSTLLDFKYFTDNSGDFPYTEKRISVEFIDEKGIKKCVIPAKYDSALYKQKNVLVIKSDSIMVDNTYSIIKLKQILKRHFTNNGNDIEYSDSPDKAIVELNLKSDTNGKELKRVLNNLTNIFDEINNETKDSLELKLFFDYDGSYY